MRHTPVLIVGGSLVGLSASLFLSWYDVPHVLVEKHAGSSPHPRAMGFTEHTMEFYRAVGIGERIPQIEPQVRLRRVGADSLAGEWTDPIPWSPGKEGVPPGKYSPCTGAAIAQDKLEHILREATVERGADVRYRHKLCDWHQDANGVVARIARLDEDSDYMLHADYLIACDGVDSGVRTQLDIGRTGAGHLSTLRSVLFSCQAADRFLETGVQQFEIEQPALSAFLTSYGDGRWVLMFRDDRKRDQTKLQQAVRDALGADLPFELITTGRWELGGRTAEQYRRGRVFLAGDAAHQLPPTRGGFGANTGIDDVYNLAWKLRRVHIGAARPSLLDSYEAERRPIGLLRYQQTFVRPDYARWLEAPIHAEMYEDAALELGQLQRSDAVIGAHVDLPPAALPEAWNGQPGTRAPHMWIHREGAGQSTVDLFAGRFTLLSEHPGWLDSAGDLARREDVDLQVCPVGENTGPLTPAAFQKNFGVSHYGATLVRPDGIVAWRSVQATDGKPSVLKNVLVKTGGIR